MMTKGPSITKALLLHLIKGDQTTQQFLYYTRGNSFVQSWVLDR